MPLTPYVVVSYAISWDANGKPHFTVNLGEPVQNLIGQDRGTQPAGSREIDYEDFRAAHPNGNALPVDGVDFRADDLAALSECAAAQIAVDAQ